MIVFEKKAAALGRTGSGPSQGRNVESLARRAATRYPDLAVLFSILPPEPHTAKTPRHGTKAGER